MSVDGDGASQTLSNSPASNLKLEQVALLRESPVLTESDDIASDANVRTLNARTGYAAKPVRIKVLSAKSS